MPALEFGADSPERQRLLRVQLPQRIARLRQRGERLQRESWDINSVSLLAEESLQLADACRGPEARTLADCLKALHRSTVALLQPPHLPDRAAASRIAKRVSALSRLDLPPDAAAATRDAVVVEGPTHAAGFPLQTVPPRDYWKRFDDMPPAPDAPVFGAAAALSTIASARFFRGLAPRQLWMRAKWVLAAGVLAPALWLNVPTLLVSAVCVGGTFVVITMAGLKEALRLGGAPASLAIGVMTAAFGAGQIAGPLMVSALGRSEHAFAWASAIAAATLVAGNCALLMLGRGPGAEAREA